MPSLVGSEMCIRDRTVAMRFKPPIITKPAKIAVTKPPITVAIEYSAPNRVTVYAIVGSKKPVTALEIEFT